jgi:Tol biopolymer transport system component
MPVISMKQNFVVTICAALLAAFLLLRSSHAFAADSDADGKIAFVGNQSGSFQLYTMNPDGSHIVRITNLAPTDLETWVPDFSSDGKRLTFCYGATDASGNLVTEIYVINVDGTNLLQLTHDGLFDCASRWSPDSTHITFMKQSTRTARGVVTIMRADGSDQKSLTTDLWGVFRSGYTPDGRKILWETQEAGFVSVLWIMNSDGTGQQRLTKAPLKAGEPSAPSEDDVVFMSNQNTPPVIPNMIFKMKVDGSDLKQLTQPVGTSHDIFPNFSPSHKKIVFASDRLSGEGNLDIFTMNADGTGITRVASGVTVGGCPDIFNCVGPAWGRSPH